MQYTHFAEMEKEMVIGKMGASVWERAICKAKTRVGLVG